MNEVAPYDWRTFFTTRLNSTEPHAPLGGITGGGWRLVFTDVQSSYQKALEEANKTSDLSYSLGVRLKEDGTISDITPGTPAYIAGLGPAMKLVGVDGHAYSIDVLRQAIRDAKNRAAPIVVLARNGESLAPYSINYHDGERYPHLERDSAQPNLLAQINKPLTTRR
jgi:predicted metalloprotease with PDZ domain